MGKKAALKELSWMTHETEFLKLCFNSIWVPLEPGPNILRTWFKSWS